MSAVDRARERMRIREQESNVSSVAASSLQRNTSESNLLSADGKRGSLRRSLARSLNLLGVDMNNEGENQHTTPPSTSTADGGSGGTSSLQNLPTSAIDDDVPRNWRDQLTMPRTSTTESEPVTIAERRHQQQMIPSKIDSSIKSDDVHVGLKDYRNFMEQRRSKQNLEHLTKPSSDSEYDRSSESQNLEYQPNNKEIAYRDKKLDGTQVNSLSERRRIRRELSQPSQAESSLRGYSSIEEDRTNASPERVVRSGDLANSEAHQHLRTRLAKARELLRSRTKLKGQFEDPEPERRLKGRRDPTAATRFDVDDNDTITSGALLSYNSGAQESNDTGQKSMKKKWRSIAKLKMDASQLNDSSSIKKKEPEVTAEKAYDFFAISPPFEEGEMPDWIGERPLPLSKPMEDSDSSNEDHVAIDMKNTDDIEDTVLSSSTMNSDADSFSRHTSSSSGTHSDDSDSAREARDGRRHARRQRLQRRAKVQRRDKKNKETAKNKIKEDNTNRTLRRRDQSDMDQRGSGVTTESEGKLVEEREKQADQQSDKNINSDNSGGVAVRASTGFLDFVVVRKPKYVPSKIRTDQSRKRIFHVNNNEIDPALKLPKGETQLRFLEDEGFFVGELPPLRQVNINRFEQRLVKRRDKGQPWFGGNGRVMTEVNPVRKFPQKSDGWFHEEGGVGEKNTLLSSEWRKCVVQVYDMRLIDGMSGSTDLNYQLDIDVSSLRFIDHPFFGPENFIMIELLELYSQYQNARRLGMIDFLTEKLDALKDASSQIKQALQTATEVGLADGVSVKEAEEIMSELRHQAMLYRVEVRNTRQERDSFRAAELALIGNIIKTWNELKRVRSEQGFCCTSHRLAVRVVETNAEVDEAELMDEVLQEVEEAREAFEMSYQQRLQNFENKVAQLEKRRQARRMEARRLQKEKRRERRRSRGVAAMAGELDDSDVSDNHAGSDSSDSKYGEDEDEYEDGSSKRRSIVIDDNIIVHPDDERFDEEAERRAIVERLYRYQRHPGEPIYIPELQDASLVSPLENCPKHEQKRRRDMSNYSMYIKVFYNGKEVCKTETRQLQADFSIYIGQIFNLKIVEWPESIVIQIYEVSMPRDTLLSEVHATIPDITNNGTELRLEEHHFSSERRMFSRYRENNSDNDISQHFLTGALRLGVAWGIGNDGEPLSPPPPPHFQVSAAAVAQRKIDPLAALGATGMINTQKLRQWLQDSRIDPNDPRNAPLMYIMRLIETGANSGNNLSNFFRIAPLENEGLLGELGEVESSKRFKLIQLRSEKVPRHRNLKMLPSVNDDISPDLDMALKCSIEDENAPEDHAKDSGKGSSKVNLKSTRIDGVPVKTVTAKGAFLQNLRDKQLIKFRRTKIHISLTDVVIENPIPDIKLAIHTAMKFFEPRRPLRPQRRERKTLAVMNPDNVSLLVQIVRGFNVPVRRETSSSSTVQQGTRDTKDENLDVMVSCVKPVIEVRFQRNLRCTSVGEGPYPQWNEELMLPFAAPDNDYSPTGLQSVQDDIYFNLFDETVIDVLQDDRERMTNIHRRIEKRWLGTFTIPFSTVYSQVRVEGKFKINTPPILLGYKYDQIKSGSLQQHNPCATYITLFITLQPPLKLSPPVIDRFESDEDRRLLTYASGWVKSLQFLHPKRFYKATCVDIHGKTVFVIRYIKPQTPPDSIEGEAGVVRFVSMIPSIEDAVTFSGACDLWTTSDQFLELGAGDEEEHAILLCNYFLYLRRNTYVVLGTAIPEGPTAYVLTVEGSNRLTLWNPSTGESFATNDPNCPLLSVGTVFGESNVWGNIQNFDEPSRINWSFTNDKAWLPFFTKRFPYPGLGTVQVENLQYLPTSQVYIDELIASLELTLKKNFEKWRSRFVTRWNRYAESILSSLLQHFESSASAGQFSEDEHNSELDSILKSYKMQGFPINLKYTDVGPITEAIFNTGVQQIEDPTAEFAMSVHVHAYPNNILSVWVYLAALTRK